MREVVLDIETTGLKPEEGHRIVEIACLELVHHVPTGHAFHRYVNPGRDMPAEARAVHGLSSEFLAGHPPFAAVVDALCRRFAIDLSGREKHGAEIDCRLLAAVYIELLGGRQPGLDFTPPGEAAAVSSREPRAPRPHAPTPDELAAHRAMLSRLSDPLWLAGD